MALGVVRKSAFNWLVAGLIASIFLAGVIALKNGHHRPCSERKCFSQLDSRLAAIEAEMKVRTADRYTGSDAKRDLIIINKRIDSMHAQRQNEK